MLASILPITWIVTAAFFILPLALNNVLAAIIPEGRHCGHTVKKLHDEMALCKDLDGHFLREELKGKSCSRLQFIATQLKIFYNVHLEPHHVIKKRSASQPLRIHIHFDESVTHLPYDHREVLKKHVRNAVHFWESALKVRASDKPVRLRRKCASAQVKFNSGTAFCVGGCARKTVCGDITIPEEHLEACIYYNPDTYSFYRGSYRPPGVDNTDFILYVATIQSQKCQEGQTIAYAAHCQQEEGLDRPVAGYFSICPHSISTARENQEQLFSTIMHEILHPLGFTAGLFAFYRDDNGEPLTPRNASTGRPLYYNQSLEMYNWSQRVARDIQRTQWQLKTGPSTKTVHLIVTPRVKEQVRLHFNCPTLEGAELEDQGIVGTVFTHWEKRVFENEAMTGIYTHNSIFSKITLAMMEDTGWYRADYSKAGDYEWGRNLGCDFVKNSCYQWIQSHLSRGESIHPFCNQVKRGEIWTDCTHNRKSVALCNLVKYQGVLDVRYQYFHSLPGVPNRELDQYAGSVALADYCPFLQEFTWTDKNNDPVRGSNCLMQHNNLKAENNYFGEMYSPSSLCFHHSNTWSLYRCQVRQSPQHAGSGCYQYSCIEGQGLIIHVHNTSYLCHHADEVMDVMFVSSSFVHTGTIKCPPCQDICGPHGVTCPPDRKFVRKKNPSYLPTLDKAFCQASSSSRQFSVSHFFTAVTVIFFILDLHVPLISAFA